MLIIIGNVGNYNTMTRTNELYFKFRNFLARRCPRFYHFCDDKKALVKFFLAGCLAGTANLIFLAILYDLVDLSIIVSTSFAFIASFLVSFSLQKLWTFRNFSQKKAASQFTLYILNAFFTLYVNGFLMHFLVDGQGVWYLFSQIIVNVLLGIYNFFIYRFIVFRDNKNAIISEQKKAGAGAGDVA